MNELLNELEREFKRGFIVEALKSKNPSFHVTVTVKKTNSSWGRDSIEMRFKGQSQITRPRVKAGDGESVAVMFTFNEVFTDPASMKGGSFIMVEAQDRSIVDGDLLSPHHVSGLGPTL